VVSAQIFTAEGLNMPGTWDSFSDPPTKAMFRMTNPPGTSIYSNSPTCSSPYAGGTINLYNNIYPAQTLATSMYRASFTTTDAGAAGYYNFLFTSGPCGNYFQNKWTCSNSGTPVAISFNSVQSYYYCQTVGSGSPLGCVSWANTDITLNASKYYTVNFQDNGYADTKGIFFETSASPVSITSLTSSYNNTASACNGAGGLIVTVTCSGTPSGPS
jgi:hypothetical protein